MQDTPDLYVVVVNDELQYSIWPAGRELPGGWRSDGFEGSRAQCLAAIGNRWTDMRPLSVRQHVGSAPTQASE